MKIGLNLMKGKIVTVILIAFLASKCHPKIQNTDVETELNLEDDCNSCFYYLMGNGNSNNFDSMVQCGRLNIRCGYFQTGTLLLAKGYTGLEQLDSSDKYASQLLQIPTFNSSDSFFYYAAMAQKAINSFLRVDCDVANFEYFQNVWTYQPEIRNQIFPYYCSLLYNCGKYECTISICNVSIRSLNDGLDKKEMAYAYEILALSHQRLGYSLDTICTYLDSSLRYHENSRVTQQKAYLCR